ncbi:MAG: PadR family transcriptional regulator, partial [Brevefilum sp.]
MATLVPDEVILGLLKAQPAHGYELLDYFRSFSTLGRIWTMSTSQLYAVLKRLERDGAVVGCEEEVSNAPPRIKYEITPQGEEQLNAWLFDDHPSPSIHRIRVLFLSRIFIANLLNINYEGIVDAQITSCEAQKRIFEEKLCT